MRISYDPDELLATAHLLVKYNNEVFNGTVEETAEELRQEIHRFCKDYKHSIIHGFFIDTGGFRVCFYQYGRPDNGSEYKVSILISPRILLCRVLPRTGSEITEEI